MILHIVDDQKFIDDSYAYAIKANNKKHKFIVLSDNKDLTFINSTPIEVFKKKAVFESSFRNSLKEYEVVLLHGLEWYKLILIFLSSKKIKFAWIGYGTDYYRYVCKHPSDLLMPRTIEIQKYDKRPKFKILLKNYILQSWIVRSIINRIKYFSPVLNSEFDLIKQNNSWFKPQFLDFNYGSGIKKVQELLEKDTELGDNVLVGNSATYENNHLDIFEALEKIDFVDREITCPLSYGREEYRSEVIKKGREVFGNKFNEITAFLPYDEYVELLSNCSVVLMNHRRQQALGNIMLMLCMGAKVFLRNENPAYVFLKKEGYIVFSIQDIVDKEKLATPLSKTEKKINRELLRERYLDKNFLEKIKNYYDSVVKY